MSDFKVQGRLGLDGSGFFSTLSQARGAVNSFGGMLAGAFSVGAITAFSKGIVDLAGKLKDVSDALGINVEFLQRFVNSAKLSGGSIEDVQSFLGEANSARQAALDNPLGKEARAFAKLGIGQNEIGSLGGQQLIEKIIASMASGVTADKLNSIKEIGGKSAKNLANGFAEGLSNAEILTSDMVSSLDELGDSAQEFYTRLQVSFAPALLEVVGALQTCLDAVDQFIAGLAAIAAGINGKDELAKMDEDVANREDQLAKYKAQLDKKVLEGLMSPEVAAKKLDEASSNSVIKNPFSTFTQGVKDEAQAQAERDAAKEAAKEAAKNKPPGIDILTATATANKEKTIKGGSLYSDSRLAVGGFLGQGANSMASIAQRQLDIQTKSMDFLKAINEKLYYNGGIIV